MNITFILGNGFDIQLGLQSRYSDFLQEYVKITPDDNDNIKEFKKYLSKKSSQDLWSDAETAMGIHLGQYSDATINAYNERVQNFESKLIEYLRQQQARCTYSDSKKISARFINFLLKSFSDALTSRRYELSTDGPSQNTYRFISFNYTDLLEQIKKCCVSGSDVIRTRTVNGTSYNDYWGSISHVHGMLNSQIIMGVNDESQLDLSGGTTLTEALRWELIKPILNQSSGQFDIQAKKAIAASHIIAIYGVSYGDTDKLWWEEIVKWLRQDSSNKLVAFIRDELEQFNPTLAWTELAYEKSKRREILKKLRIEESDPDFEELIEQVYIVLNTAKLNLSEILIPENSDDKVVAASTTPSGPTAI